MTLAKLRKYWPELLIVAGALAVRLVLASTAPHPGIADPSHYYNLAQSLREGRGFEIDYVWQYHHPPEDVTHPIDHWMPLTAVWPAAAQTLFGESLLAALLPSVIAGGLLPLLSGYIAGRLGGGRAGRLFAMAATAVVPEFILNSVRTDTTIFYVWFVGLTLLLLYHGTSPAPPNHRRVYLFLGGAAAGLAHLTRQDGLLLAGVFVVYAALYRRRVRWREVWLFPLGWLVVFGPWIARNAAVLGEAMPSGVMRSLFLTTIIDQYSYAKTFDLSTYLQWGLGNIVGKRVFEALASIKLIYTLPGAVLSVAAALGLGEAAVKRARRDEQVRLLSLPLLTLAAFFGFYAVLVPFLSQGGSFKKSYMATMPFLVALGAVTVERHVTARRTRAALAALVCGMLLLDGLVLVKNDFALTRSYLDDMRRVADVLDDAGDTNGDSEVIVMAQDPFMLNYLGFRAMMIPNDTLDVTLDVAARYDADYIMMPPARESLDPIYRREASDPRLVWVADVPGTRVAIYRVNAAQPSRE